MKRYLLLFALLFSFNPAIYAQWQLLDLGTGSSGQKMEVVNDSIAFITFSKGRILRTIDEGAVWNEINVASLDGETLYDIDFGNEQTGIITTQSDFLIRTADQGENWEKIPLMAFSDGSGDISSDPAADGNSSIRTDAICFYDSDTVLVTLSWKDNQEICHSYLWKSKNGGVDWTQIPFDLNEVMGETQKRITYNGMAFLQNQLSGYLIGSLGTILKVKNLGEQVEKVDLTGHSLEGNSINDLFIENGEVYLATQAGLYRTTDDFETINPLTSVYAFDVLKLPDGTILQGGLTSKKATSRSTDLGATWQVAENGSGNLFELELFGDFIYGLSSSGKSYVLPVAQLQDPVVEIDFTARGKIVEFENRSQNVGTPRWDFSDETFSEELAPVHLFEEHGAYWAKLSMENALGVVTDSLLVEINPMLVDYQVSVVNGNVIEFNNACSNYYEIVGWDFGDRQISAEENPQHVFGQFGSYNVTLYASDGLDTLYIESPVVIDQISAPWFAGQIPTSNTLAKMGMADDLNAVIIGNNTTILHTADGGETWNTAVLPENIPAHNANDVEFFNSQNGLASFSAKSSTNGFLLKTEDAGSTWSELPIANLSDQTGDGTMDIALGEKIYFYGLACTGSNTAFVTTRWEYQGVKHGYVFKTIDGGNTWSRTSEDIYNGYTSVYNALKFSPDKQIAVLAGVKKLWISYDGGETWNDQEAIEFGSINDVDFLDDANLFLACQNGTYKTSDAGKSGFVKVDEDYSFDVIAIDEHILFTGKNRRDL